VILGSDVAMPLKHFACNDPKGTLTACNDPKGTLTACNDPKGTPTSKQCTKVKIGILLG